MKSRLFKKAYKSAVFKNSSRRVDMTTIDRKKLEDTISNDFEASRWLTGEIRV
jgi:hypothetical protein